MWEVTRSCCKIRKLAAQYAKASMSVGLRPVGYTLSYSSIDGEMSTLYYALVWSDTELIGVAFGFWAGFASLGGSKDVQYYKL